MFLVNVSCLAFLNIFCLVFLSIFNSYFSISYLCFWLGEEFRSSLGFSSCGFYMLMLMLTFPVVIFSTVLSNEKKAMCSRKG